MGLSQIVFNGNNIDLLTKEETIKNNEKEQLKLWD